MSWRLRWQIDEYVRNSLWLVPGVFTVFAIVLGVVLPVVDERTSVRLGLSFGVGTAEGMLSAIAGGMITFTGFVFSILLLAVQFGSGQFSPRMLRRFLRAPTTKISLGVFIATFVYSLTVLRTIGRANKPNFVPDTSISVALLLLLASMAMFLRLISKTTQGLRVAAVLRQLGQDGVKVIQSTYGDPVAEGVVDAEPTPLGSGPTRIVRFDQTPGVLQSVDASGLVRRACEADIVIELIPPVGDPIAPDMALFRVHGTGAIDDEQLRRSVAVGDERTLRQDPAFALRLLADISSKALSPGINDPTTAVQTLDQIEVLLQALARRRLTPGELRDDAGHVRFCYPARSWPDFLSIALDETRCFGAGSAQVTRRLRALLEDLRADVPPVRRSAIEAQLALLASSVEQANSDPGERTIAAAADRQGLGTPRRPR